VFVRLSVYLSVVGLLLWARQAGNIDRLMHGRRSAAAAAPQQRHAAAKCGQCHVVR